MLVIERQRDVLRHPVAAPKIGYALTKMPNSVQLKKNLVESINNCVMGNIGSLNQVDLFMYIKFLDSEKVKNICKNEDSPFLN